VRHFVNRVTIVARVISKFVLALAVSLPLMGSHSFAASKSKHAAIVIDANTGKTLYASNADAPRHPASLTKMMTLYMVFEAMAKGKIGKNSKMIMSKHAASMAPTKLGIKAGSSLTVETAIYALVTKSANDAAAATAEFIGGSESNFAQMMTAKARSIGMGNTRFYNASGLPDARQITTARDMATLGIALRKNFPQYYSYFSARSFTYGRSRMANHNKLLGRVAGVDGIKTGYTRASGFNLVSSVALGNKRVVSVVLGGTSGRSRDAEMAGLIAKYVPKASTKATGGALVAMRNIFKSKDVPVVAETVENVQVSLNEVNVVIPADRPEAIEVDQTIAAEDVEEVAIEQPKALALAAVKKPIRPIVPLTEEIEDNAGGVNVAKAEEAPLDPITTASAPDEEQNIGKQSASPKGAWIIQIAAADSEIGAMKILTGAKTKGGKALASAEPFTQSVRKGSVTLYRARFGGFETKDAAWKACAALKKQNLGCFALNN
jgi:D-alanyl-D-alanine carboxypeptidase